jgi:hypothetical protein
VIKSDETSLAEALAIIKETVAAAIQSMTGKPPLSVKARSRRRDLAEAPSSSRANRFAGRVPIHPHCTL